MAAMSQALRELKLPGQSARKRYAELERAVDEMFQTEKRSQIFVLVGDKQVELPREYLELLRIVVRELESKHQIFTIADPEGELTPSQAAKFLGISRPLLVKLLDGGRIPFRNLPGSRHRKVAMSDLIAYRAQSEERRRILRDAMNELDREGVYWQD